MDGGSRKNPPLEPAGKAALISDVAREARVSIATVSRVLSRPEQVRAELRLRVREAVDRLGYTPNAAARSLRAKNSHAVLVLTRHRWSAPFFAEVLRGLDVGLAEHGYTMILGNLDGGEGRHRSLLDMMFSGRVDGAVVLSGTVAAAGTRSMLDAGLPIVSIGAPVEGTHQIVTDEGEAIVRGAVALTALGHRRFLYLPGPPDNPNEMARWASLNTFFAAQAASGISIGRAEVGGFSTASGVASAQAFLRAGCPESAVIAVCDEAAIGFMKTVRTAGRRVPEDVSILGFDGIEFADFCEPTLSTIRQPRYEYGRMGADLLVECIGESAPRLPERRLLQSGLQMRGSTGAAPAR